MSIHDVPIDELLRNAAAELKKMREFTPPDWAVFVKTGVSRERPPTNPDWWHVRAASMLRRIQLLGPVGVSKLKRKYGGRKNRGDKPDKFLSGSGNITRKILQQLEKAGFAKQAQKGVHKGRILTPRGFSFLDKIATEIMKQKGIVLPKREVRELRDIKKELKGQKDALEVQAKAKRKEAKGAKETVKDAAAEAKPETPKPKRVRKPKTDAPAQPPAATAEATPATADQSAKASKE